MTQAATVARVSGQEHHAGTGTRASGEASRQLISRLQQARERSAQLRSETAKILAEGGRPQPAPQRTPPQRMPQQQQQQQQARQKRGRDREEGGGGEGGAAGGVEGGEPAASCTVGTRGQLGRRFGDERGTPAGSPAGSVTPLPHFPLPLPQPQPQPQREAQALKESEDGSNASDHRQIQTKRLQAAGQAAAKDEVRVRPRQSLTSTAAAAAAARGRGNCKSSDSTCVSDNNDNNNSSSGSRGSGQRSKADSENRTNLSDEAPQKQPELPIASDSPVATLGQAVLPGTAAKGRWGRPPSPQGGLVAPSSLDGARGTRRLLRIRLCTLDFEPAADGSFAAPALLETWGIRAMLHLRSDAPVKWVDSNPVTQHRQQLRFGRAVSWDGSYTPQVRLDFDEEVDIPLPASFLAARGADDYRHSSDESANFSSPRGVDEGGCRRSSPMFDAGPDSDSSSQRELGPLAVDLWMERRTIAEKLDTFLDRVGWGNNLPEFDRTWLGRAICSIPPLGQDAVPEKWVVIANTNVAGHHPRWLSLGFEWVTEEVNLEEKHGQAAQPSGEVVVVERSVDEALASLKDDDGIEVVTSTPDVSASRPKCVPVCSLWPCPGFA